MNCPKCSSEITCDDKNIYCRKCGITIPFEICGVSLTEQNALDLLHIGRTDIIKGFRSQRTGKNFDASLCIDKKTGKVKFMFDTFWKCPVCKGELKKSDNGIYCSNYKSGCKFEIPDEICGKTISDSQKNALVTKGRTPLIKGFVSPDTEKIFDAHLEVDKETGKLKFTFDTLGSCPVCGNKLLSSDTNIYCSAYKKSDCKFSVPFELCGKKLTKAQINSLINSKETGVIKGFTAKSGKLFNAALQVDSKTGKLEFNFDKRE